MRVVVFPREAFTDRPLRSPWASLLSIGWVSIGIALIIVASGSGRVGKPVWWLGDGEPISPSPLWVVPLIAPFAAAIAARATALLALTMSGVASVTVAAVAVGDLGGSRGAALVEFVLAGAGLLLTAAASAGVPTRQRPERPR